MIAHIATLPNTAWLTVHKSNGDAVNYSLDGASRQATLDVVIKEGLQRMEDSTTTFRIAGKEYVLKEQVAEVAKLVLWAKVLVTEATKASPVASIAWVGVCLFLPLLTHPPIADEDNKDGFKYVTARMSYYVALEPLLHRLAQSPEVLAPDTLKREADSHLVNLYQHILKFQISSVLRFYKGRFKRYATDVVYWSDWKKMKVQVQELDALVNQNLVQMNGVMARQELESLNKTNAGHLEALQALLSEGIQIAKEQRDIAQGHRDIAQEQLDMQKDEARHKLSEEQQRCLHLFRLTDATKDATYEWYKNRVEDRLDGTCQWFLRHENFTRWRNEKTGPLLVSADPGCGKSVLAKYLVTKLLPGPDVTVCYFFFKDGDQNTMRQALCAILHQLFCQRPQLIKHAVEQHRSNGNGLINSKHSLWTVFENSVGDPEAGPVIVVIDALDECDGLELESLTDKVTEQFCRGLRNFNNLRYLLTSRPYEQVIASLRNLSRKFPHVRIPGEEESDTISQEVNAVIRHRVNQMGFAEKVTARLEERLLEIPHRTYLWVYLIFDHLRTANFKKTERGVEAAIETLPRNVNEAYEQILQKSTEPDWARKSLTVVLAANRPLTLSEMNNAVNVDMTLTTFEDLDLEKEEDFRKTLRSWCGLFISVHHGKVYFLHQTAREFLLANSIPNPSSSQTMPHPVPGEISWRHSVTSQDAHGALAIACFAYLRLFNNDEHGCDILEAYSPYADFNEVQEDYLKNRPFLLYSAEHWSDHFREADFDIEAPIIPFVLGICDPRFRSYSTWSRLFRIGYYGLQRPSNTLLVVSYLGHDKITKLLLAQGAKVEAIDEEFRTSLSHASEQGHEAVVRRLLDHGANVDAEDGSGRTPLSHASEDGHEAVVRLLLDHGANVHAKGIWGRTPLSYASENGHEAVVRRLLDHGANVDAVDGLGRTPLSDASGNGHEAVVKQLLDHGANVDVKSLTGQTPLSYASRSGYEAIIKQLLGYGAIVDT
jgi:ankyrin repeat protein